MRKSFSYLSLLTLVAWAVPSYADKNITQTTMLATFQQVVSLFSQEYAPLELKEVSTKLDLQAEIKRVEEFIESHPDITTAQFQDLLHGFVTATRDFHANIQFYATEEASLPFQIMGAGGRYFISYVDRAKLPVDSLPGFSIGTEVIEFDGKPIHQAVRELIPVNFVDPTPTDWRLAEMYLTSRARSRGWRVPQGEVLLKTVSPTGENFVLPFTWQYTPEYMPADIPIRNRIFAPSENGAPKLKFDVNPAVAPGKMSEDGPVTIGSLASIVPTLGVPIGGLGETFRSYLFKLTGGKLIGYIRIPTFTPGDYAKSADEFGNLVRAMNTTTDALVIDLTHNPGGSVDYMYGLLSRLTDRPLETLKMKIIVSPKGASESAERLTTLPFIQSEEQAKRYLDTMFPSQFTTFQMLQALIANDRFILNELKQGRRLTNPTWLSGISRIVPHPHQRYTKPILVLVDELDFREGISFRPSCKTISARRFLAFVQQVRVVQ